MTMPVTPMATQCNSAVTQHPTVIFAAAPPGHPMSIPVITGFPPAPTMQVHSTATPSVLAMHHGPQPVPPPLGHAQAIHIHHHPGQSLPPPNLQGPTVQGFPPSLPPPQAPSISSNNVHNRGPIYQQQEFNDPAIMSVSKLPPPRPSLQQRGVQTNPLSTNIMQMNPRGIETSHQHGPKPSIPASSNVKSVQDLERELMGGSVVNRANNTYTNQQANKTYQHIRSQGQLQQRGAYNSNHVTRQMQSGFRNNQPNQV